MNLQKPSGWFWLEKERSCSKFDFVGVGWGNAWRPKFLRHWSLTAPRDGCSTRYDTNQGFAFQNVKTTNSQDNLSSSSTATNGSRHGRASRHVPRRTSRH